MTITISPSEATVNAADKPYQTTWSAVVSFEPSYYVWTLDGLQVYSSSVFTDLGGGSYQISGPEMVVNRNSTEIEVTVTPAAGGGDNVESYTTASQLRDPDITLELLSQKDGVPLVDQVSQPMAPLVSPISGEDQVQIAWSKGASGQTPKSNMIIRVTAENEDNLIARIRMDWGDGNYTDVTGYNGNQLIKLVSHEYQNFTGSVTITGTIYKPDETPEGLAGVDTLATTITADATGWYVQQYRIQQYQDQPGMRSFSTVSWRDIAGESQDFRHYGILRGHEYHHQLQLREVDTTGRPVRTSTLSTETITGPWS